MAVVVSNASAAAPAPSPPFFKVLTEFPSLDGDVHATALDPSTNTLYIGGTFTMIGTQARSRLAAFDATTGDLLPWNPGANGTVNGIAIGNGIVYVGGAFTSISSSPRPQIAAINASTGVLVEDWAPSSNPANFTGTEIFAVAVNGSTVYAGGAFTGTATFSGIDVNYVNIASFNATTGRFLPWNPVTNAGGNVRVLVVSGDINIAYAAGDFSTIGGASRARLAAIDLASGTATTWNPNPNAAVSSIFFTNSSVYLGGTFTSIGGQPRNRLAAVDIAVEPATGLAQAWNPNVTGAGGTVVALYLDGSTIYAGGVFAAVGGVARTNLAAIDITSGIATNWNPAPNAAVRTIIASGTTFFAGGGFTQIAASGDPSVTPVARRGLAAIVDVSLGTPTIEISGNPQRKTKKNKLKIKGTASALGDIVRVEVKPGKGKSYRAATLTSRGWKYTVKNLKVGKNRVKARAYDNTGTKSNIASIVVTRNEKN